MSDERQLDVSVVLCTYNRAGLLAGALTSILRQTSAATFELIVVDNNSHDNTAEVVREFEKADERVKYIFEPKQGNSYGRNSGIALARAEFVAFTDDDVRVNPDWLDRMLDVFRRRPDVGYVGGKVLPLWPRQPPIWLTPDHWSPLALVDYGDEPLVISSKSPRVIVSANLMFRRQALVALGGFRPELQRVRNGIGSMEDLDIEERYWALGGLGFYDPAIVIHADIQPNRLEKPYHRKWHRGHGHFHAIGGGDRYYPSTNKYFGVPSGMYRRVARLIVDWAKHRAFASETELWFISGFMRQRIRKHFARA